MANVHSYKRIMCVDYIKRHKKAVYKTETSRLCTVGDLADEIKMVVGPSITVNRDDILCSNCIKYYKKKFLEKEYESDEDISISDEPFLPKNEIVDAINDSIKTLNADISPLKYPSEIRSDRKESYVKKKKMKLEKILVTSAVDKLEAAYDVNIARSTSTYQKTECSNCNEWLCNIQEALQNCEYNEKIRLLTLLPDNLCKREILEKLPDVSKYLIDKSRKIKKEKGVYAQTDPYVGHHLSAEVLNTALSYYIEDSKDCSKNSPNKNDVICVKNENGEKIKKVKRFMTRSIKETYNLMKKENPSVKIGLSKFYSLRPKHVKIQPIQATCCCIYCSNLKLICVALKNLTKIEITEENLMMKCLCQKLNNENCWLGECVECPGTETLTDETLNLSEEDDVLYAIWEGGDLIKKSVSVTKFIDDIRLWVKKGITHNYVRRVQREGISEAKSMTKNDSALVIHFDFAENWSVILPNEIQSYHWQNVQVSLFTCVAYFQEETKSFVVVSDDTTHDTAHALYAIQRIKSKIFELYQLKSIKSVVYISDGAAAHFKNKYQFHEFSNCHEAEERKWIFSATGHGKSACDAIGGLCKHFATKYNLQKEPLKAITDSLSFVTVLSNLMKDITLLNVDKETIKTYRINKQKEWTDIKSIVGIRAKHYWLARKKDSFMGHTYKDQVIKVNT